VVAIALNRRPSSIQTKAAQVSQLVFASLGEPSTFNYPLNQSLYSVLYLYDGLLTENGLTGAGTRLAGVLGNL